MVEVVRTDDFDAWIRKLKDRAGRLRILSRIDRHTRGNRGDVKTVGNGCRVYFVVERGVVILLLCGGDKSSQQRDIAKAHRLAEQWRAATGKE